ncbi:hypothetical protein OWM07_10185 [Deferribacter thermophilus]|uniref:hypothetical protein n=1 Tax=Deferribacter thermophilus TaxID=53573 RepID=UPI003C25D12B
MSNQTQELELKNYSFIGAIFVEPEEILADASAGGQGYLHIEKLEGDLFVLLLTDDKLSVSFLTPPFTKQKMGDLILDAFDNGKRELGIFLLQYLSEKMPVYGED